MGKLAKLKQLLVFKFSDKIRNAQRGHKFEHYHDIREAMLAINMIESFTVDINSQTTILDYYLRKLNEIKLW